MNTAEGDPVSFRVAFVSGEFFATAGRTFAPDKIATGAAVAVISESLARTYWPDQSPLGQILAEEIPVTETRPLVIGVVADAITLRVHARNTLAVYEPLAAATQGARS